MTSAPSIPFTGRLTIVPKDTHDASSHVQDGVSAGTGRECDREGASQLVDRLWECALRQVIDRRAISDVLLARILDDGTRGHGGQQSDVYCNRRSNDHRWSQLGGRPSYRTSQRRAGRWAWPGIRASAKRSNLGDVDPNDSGRYDHHAAGDRHLRSCHAGEARGQRPAAWEPEPEQAQRERRGGGRLSAIMTPTQARSTLTCAWPHDVTAD